jgi:type VI secretion system protein ImpF
MAELTHKERLQPSLLDRLTDDEPDKTQESRSQRVLSPSRLRESVRRDLVWLFNTTNLVSMQPDIADHPHVASSVVNFGLPDLAGHTASSVDIPALERLLRNAIWEFEPRLERSSVKVRLAIDPDEMSHNAMTFTIEATLWAQPLPLRLFLKTEIDLETGEVTVDEDRKQRSE